MTSRPPDRVDALEVKPVVPVPQTLRPQNHEVTEIRPRSPLRREDDGWITPPRPLVKIGEARVYPSSYAVDVEIEEEGSFTWRRP